ncbi:MAG: hypothetical protein FGM41_00910 [Bacteroidetes bacterium]|nr:hypothetical protein [Bacteroidota bacterium]
MKTYLTLALFLFLNISAIAQDCTVRMKMSKNVGFPGRTKIFLNLSDASGERQDSSVLGLDSTFAFKFPVKGIGQLYFSAKGNLDFPASYFIILPKEQLLFGFEKDEKRDSINEIVLTRYTELDQVLDVFDALLIDYSYGIDDSITFNKKLHDLKIEALQLCEKNEALKGTPLYLAAKQGIDMKAALAYTRFAYYARFQQKHKSFNFLAPTYFDPIRSLLKAAPLMPLIAERQEEIRYLVSQIDSVKLETALLSDLNRSMAKGESRDYISIYPKSDGPNCTYGYAGNINNPYQLDASIEGWFISPQFDKAEDFSEYGLAVVERAGMYQFINYRGENVLDRNYEKLIFVDGEYYIARYEGAYGLISKKGDWVLPFVYERIVTLGQGLLGFQPKNSPFMGLMHWQGQVLIPAKYNYIYPFEGNDYTRTVIYDANKWERGNGKGTRKPGEKYGIITPEGKELLSPNWYSPMPQANNYYSSFPLAIYERKYNSVFHFYRNKEFFMLSEKGTIIKPSRQFRNLNKPGKHLYFASNNQEGICKTYDGQWQSEAFRVNYRGIQTIGNDYFYFQLQATNQVVLLKDQALPIQADTFQDIQRLDYDSYSSQSGSPIYKVQALECFGLLNASGKFVIPIKYDTLEYLDSILAVKQNSYYAIFDTAGKQITPFKYKAIRFFGDQSINLLELQTDSSIQVCDRNLKILFEAKGAQAVWMDGAADAELCNWSYLKDGYLYQYDRSKHHLPYLGQMHYRQLYTGTNMVRPSLINRKGEWLGEVQSEENADSAAFFIVQRFGAQQMVTPENKQALPGSYQEIAPLYYDADDKKYSTYSYSYNDKPAYYLCTTLSFGKGLVRKDFTPVLDTLYQDIDVSKSMLIAKQGKLISILDTTGKLEHTLKVSSNRNASILFDTYIRTNRTFGGFKLYSRAGEKLGKFRNGNVTQAPNGNLYIARTSKQVCDLYTPAFKKINKEPFSIVARSKFNLLLVQEEEKQKWLSLNGVTLATSKQYVTYPLYLNPNFYAWLDTSNTFLVKKDSSYFGFNVLQEKQGFMIAYETEDYSYSNNSAEILFPSDSLLKQNPSLAGAVSMASYMELEKDESGIKPTHLGTNYVVFEHNKLSDGIVTPFTISYYFTSDSLYRLNPYDVIPKEKKMSFARLITQRISSDDAINWDVCVKPEEQFRFLNPQFSLKEDGITVIIRKLKVQNSETNDLELYLSKAELLPYLNPQSHFYRWFYKP